RRDAGVARGADVARRGVELQPLASRGSSGDDAVSERGRSESHRAGGQAVLAPRARLARDPGGDETEPQQGQIATIVGQDNLRKLHEADGETGESEHRGS